MRRTSSWCRGSAIVPMLMLPLLMANAGSAQQSSQQPQSSQQQPAQKPQSTRKQQSPQKQGSEKSFNKEQLDQLTAQIALYPDALLSQVLMASTYPDEFMQAAAWAKEHPDAKGDEAVKQVADKQWDPSVASLVAFPQVLITLGQKPDYVKDLGDAFLGQPEDVMDSIQRLRAKAKEAGNLESNKDVKVSTEAVESAPPPTSTATQQATPSQVIVIEPAQPSVAYVPAYNPATVYGAWAYPAYPPVYAAPPPGYWFSRTVATGIAWGIGIGVTNAIWGGCNWGHHDVDINVNRYNNINANRRIDANGNRTTWNHNPQHRREPYRGGQATRQRLDRQYQAGNREQYRGREPNREASRERAQQTMANRGVNVDRSSAQQRAQNIDRDAARQQVASRDRGAARQQAQVASRDNAFRGSNSTRAGGQASRGAASHGAARGRAGGGRRR